MGVPAFYRWISEKYPKIVVDVLEQRPMVLDGTVIPMNLNDPNPNSVEFDHLYIDMNGLIHPCSHPEDREAPTTEEEMYVNVMKYVDRLVAAVRPRRVLFLAIDGVAPRAKMNQQRSRRFRSAQEARERKQVMEETMHEMIDMGYDIPEKDHEWDSNVITPGTVFMTKLSNFLRFYVLDRMNKDPFWQNLKVIVSDASEPGEGEHKIMDFIRSQRAQPDYDPNIHHVLHGLDADLIMLALATHEVRFTILREKVFFGRQDKDKEGEVSEAQKLLNAQSMKNGAMISCLNPNDEWIYKKPLQALHIHTLREYLANEFSCLNPDIVLQSGQNYQITMNMQRLSFPFDLERIIDDFIFMCFFVGNDFLPHLPSLDIRDGALDFLIECYKEMLPSLGDYLTRPGGYINLQPADVLLSKVGEIEDQIFQLKNQKEQQFETKMERRRQERQGQGNGGNNGQYRQQFQQQYQQQITEHNRDHSSTTVTSNTSVSTVTGNHSDKNNVAANALREKLSLKRSTSAMSVEKNSEADIATTPVDDVQTPTSKRRKKGDSTNDDDNETISDEEDELDHTIVTPIIEKIKPKKVLTEEELQAAKNELKTRLKAKESNKLDEYKKTITDSVKLHETGWKSRYYNEPFKRENIEHGGGLKQMCISYVQGLCWVLQYYYQGVPSWNWYYPFHYAPFASDLVNIDTYGIVDQFEKSKPFRPLEQLLAVLPPTSAHALPQECHWLMLDAKKSPIIDLYKEDIPIDPNGKHLPWLWILLLPFIDERRISKAFLLCKDQLTYESRQRNRFGQSVIFIHSNHSLVYEFGRQHGLLAPAPETDPELLDEPNFIDIEGDASSSNAITTSKHDDTAIDENFDDNPIVPFTCNMAESLSGSIGKAPTKWYAALNQRVVEPNGSQRWGMSMIPTNHVAVFTYKLPTHGVHESKLLPGSIAPESPLTAFDLQIRRPPRLNKSGFNVLDLFYNSRPDRQPSYQSLQERTGGYLKHDDRFGTLHGGGYNGNNLAPMNMSVSSRSLSQFQHGNSGGGYQQQQQQGYHGNQGYNDQGRSGGQGGYGQYNNQQQGQGGQYHQQSRQNSGFSHSANLQQNNGGGGRGGDYRHRVEPINYGGGYGGGKLGGNNFSGNRSGSGGSQQQSGYNNNRGQSYSQSQSQSQSQPQYQQQQQQYQRSGYSHNVPANNSNYGGNIGGMSNGMGVGMSGGGSSMEALRAKLLQTHQAAAANGGGMMNQQQPPYQQQQQQYQQQQGYGRGQGQSQDPRRNNNNNNNGSYNNNNSGHQW